MGIKTYFLETFGCQMNVLDSELIEGQLRRLGFRRVESSREADVVLFNTCSVRQHAEDKVLSRLGGLKAFKQRRPGTLIGVLGCMAERQKEALFEQVPHLDLICGPGELHRLPGLLAEAAEARERGGVRTPGLRLAALGEDWSRRTPVEERIHDVDSLEALDLSRDSRDGDVLQAYVRVQRGCDQFCTYCVVPFTRGPERSRPPEHVLAEARSLAQAGCREVTLLGQTVNSYVHEEKGRIVRFARLLERVHAIAGLDRIRFVTSFPADWDEDIFRVMRDYPRVCPYLHIPAQSGSDRILRAMKRGYTVDEYLRLMDMARQYVPEIALAGDFIVGFCGESEADFRATVALVERVQYKSIFVFKYSPRPGTAADRSRADDVPAEVKAARNHELLAVQSGISRRQKQALVGQTVEVLVEGYSKVARRAQAAQQEATECASGTESEQERGQEAVRGRVALPLAGSGHQLIGRTRQDLITVFDGRAEHIGALVNVRVESASPLTLFGHLEAVVAPARTVSDGPQECGPSGL
jgi:tRNA-2-methylthio-N6-dimethylallyladenosine synthase